MVETLNTSPEHPLTLDERLAVVERELDACRAELVRARSAEARALERARLLAEHLLAAERVNSRVLPAEDEVQRLTLELAEIEPLKAAITERDGRLEVERAAAEARLAYVQQMNAVELHRVRMEAEQTVAAIKRSTSWKLTAPLRAVVSLLRWRWPS